MKTPKVMYTYTPEMGTWLKAALKQVKWRQVNLVKATKLQQTLISSLVNKKSLLVDAKKWELVQSTLVAKGAKPPPSAIDPKNDVVDRDKLRKDLLAVKKATGTTWKNLASSFDSHQTTLTQFIHGTTHFNNVTAARVRARLDELDKLNDKLVAQGSLKPASSGMPRKTVQQKVDYVKEVIKEEKATRLHVSPKVARAVGAAPQESVLEMTDEMLDLRELALLDRIRQRRLVH